MRVTTATPHARRVSEKSGRASSQPAKPAEIAVWDVTSPEEPELRTHYRPAYERALGKASDIHAVFARGDPGVRQRRIRRSVCPRFRRHDEWIYPPGNLRRARPAREEAVQPREHAGDDRGAASATSRRRGLWCHAADSRRRPQFSDVHCRSSADSRCASTCRSTTSWLPATRHTSRTIKTASGSSSSRPSRHRRSWPTSTHGDPKPPRGRKYEGAVDVEVHNGYIFVADTPRGLLILREE